LTRDEYLQQPPFAIPGEAKQRELLRLLDELTEHHRELCAPYARWLTASSGLLPPERAGLAGVPFLPIPAFKQHDLLSVPRDQVYKVLRSSGTSGQATSRVYLDRSTATLQSRVFSAIASEFLGKKRLPMLIVGQNQTSSSQASLSASSAGAIGLASQGRDHFHLLDDEGRLRLAEFEAYRERHNGGPFLFFGLTFQIWTSLLEDERPPLSLAGSVLVQAGGWKKLLDRAVPKSTFKQRVAERLGITRVHDYYGMVEQVGSIYFECESGRLHAPSSSEILIRQAGSWSCLPDGEVGLIQTLSLLPTSYPGHSLLTEDRGRILGRDDCPCGRLGTTFEVLGRSERAEPRGCSDTLESTPPPLKGTLEVI
jgi:hypothetical protein